MNILGIDPGTNRMGYGVVEDRGGGSYRCLAVGCMTTHSGTPTSVRLSRLQGELQLLLETHQPGGAVLERLFFSKNTRTALSIAEARGMILTTLARARIPIVELSPQHVKLGVTGYGKATKRQVQQMVQWLFDLPTLPTPDDAADALALAFTGVSYFHK